MWFVVTTLYGAAGNTTRAFAFSGLKKMDLHESVGTQTKTPYFPSAYVEGLAEYFGEYKTESNFCPPGQDPFRLENLNRDIYSHSSVIDTTTIYKKTFVNFPNIVVMSRFVANNKSYICAQITRRINERGIQPLVEGDFYAL